MNLSVVIDDTRYMAPEVLAARLCQVYEEFCRKYPDTENVRKELHINPLILPKLIGLTHEDKLLGGGKKCLGCTLVYKEDMLEDRIVMKWKTKTKGDAEPYPMDSPEWDETISELSKAVIVVFLKNALLKIDLQNDRITELEKELKR